MTDTFKEFYNGSLTYSQLVAGVNMVSPGASATDIVKEIMLRSSYERKFSMYIDTMRIIDWVGEGLLKGAEIVAPNKNLVLKTHSILMATGIAEYASTTQMRTLRVSPAFSDDQLNTTESQPVVTTTVSTITTVPDFIVQDPAGDVYFGVRGNATLRKRAGGMTGAETTYTVASSAKCWDGSRYIYSASTTTLTIFDTLTDTVSSVPFSQALANFNNTNSRFAVIDGHLFHYGNGTAIVEVFNVTTGAFVSNISGLPGLSSVVAPFEVQKDDFGNYVMIAPNSTTSITTVNFGPSIITPSPVSRAFPQAAHGLSVNAISGPNRFFKQPNAFGVVGSVVSNAFKIWDLTTGKPICTQTISGLNADNFLPLVDLTAANNAFGAVTARAIGVEVT